MNITVEIIYIMLTLNLNFNSGKFQKKSCGYNPILTELTLKLCNLNNGYGKSYLIKFILI